MKHHCKDFGFELDRNGNITQRAPPLPDACEPSLSYFLAMGHNHCPDLTLRDV